MGLRCETFWRYILQSNELDDIDAQILLIISESGPVSSNYVYDKINKTIGKTLVIFKLVSLVEEGYLNLKEVENNFYYSINST